MNDEQRAKVKDLETKITSLQNSLINEQQSKMTDLEANIASLKKSIE